MYLENIAATGMKYRMLLNGYRPNVSPVNSYRTLLYHVLLSVRTFEMVLVLIFKCIMLSFMHRVVLIESYFCIGDRI